MKKILIIVILATFIFIAINVLNDGKENLLNNIENSLSNSMNSTSENKVQSGTSNNQKVENDIIENDVVLNNIIENEIKDEAQNQVQNEVQENVNNNEIVKQPDNSYVGEEENSKDDYDSELDGENKAIILVKQYLGDKAFNYTFNVETITSSAYVVRAMDENSSNTYYSVNFTTWVVSEI